MERQRQEMFVMSALIANKTDMAYRWDFLCADGAPFSAVAPSEAGALRVLNAERPGMHAMFEGRTRARDIEMITLKHRAQRGLPTTARVN